MRIGHRVHCWAVLAALLILWHGTAWAEDRQLSTPSKEETGKSKVSSKTHVRLGGIMVGAGYSHYSSPYYWNPYYSPYGLPMGYYGWPYYESYSPWLHPGFYRGFTRESGMGEVRLSASDRNAEVYIDGAYAGIAQDLKSIWLDPGAYNLEVKDEAGQSYKNRVYVLSGKTVRISAALGPPQQEETP